MYLFQFRPVRPAVPSCNVDVQENDVPANLPTQWESGLGSVEYNAVTLAVVDEIGDDDDDDEMTPPPA